MQDAELVPKREVFQLEGGSRLEACQSDGGQQVHGAQNQMEDPMDARQGSMFSCSSRFTVGTVSNSLTRADRCQGGSLLAFGCRVPAVGAQGYTATSACATLFFAWYTSGRYDA